MTGAVGTPLGLWFLSSTHRTRWGFRDPSALGAEALEGVAGVRCQVSRLPEVL